MRITRIYLPVELNCGQTTQLDADTSNHLIRVLRTKIGSPITLFNGNGFDYSCTTLDANTKKTLLSINSNTEVINESNLNITLIQGISRQDRMETTIQKAVELGVNKIIPANCQRSNIKLKKEKLDKKLAYWRNVAISACEQSGRCIIPEIAEITTLEIIHSQLPKDILRYTLNPESNTSFKDICLPATTNIKHDIAIFIGPEGGISADEISYLKHNQFQDINFGPRILRTETAGPAVISALQMLWGDF